MNTDSEDRIMIAELERIIRAEEAKPEAERDLALIDDCIKEIAEIKGVKAEFSEEEVAQITDKLIQTAEKTKKRKRFVRLVAGIAAMFVIVTGVTACAVNPALINWVTKIVRMPFGSIAEQNSITYNYQGMIERYDNIEELLTSNHLEIYYPAALPNNERINYVDVVVNNDKNIVHFKFTTESIHYSVQLQYVSPLWEEEATSMIESNELLFSVYPREDYYISYTINDGNTYIIQTNSIQDMITVIGGLTK